MYTPNFARRGVSLAEFFGHIKLDFELFGRCTRSETLARAICVAPGLPGMADERRTLFSAIVSFFCVLGPWACVSIAHDGIDRMLQQTYDNLRRVDRVWISFIGYAGRVSQGLGYTGRSRMSLAIAPGIAVQ